MGHYRDITAPPPSGKVPPPLRVAALNLKTWQNPATNASEIVAVSVVYHEAVRQNVPFAQVRNVA